MTDSSPAVAPQVPREVTLVLVLGMLAAFGPLAIDMYLPAFPAIGQDLGASSSLVGMTLAVYFAGLSFGQIVVGPLSDRFGRVLPVRAGLVLFAMGSAAAALAPQIEVLIGARVIQAFGGAAGAVASRAIVRDRYRGSDAARMNSRIVLVMGLAPIVAPLLGGFVLDLVGWRAIFWFLAGAAAVALGIVWRVLPETAPERTSVPKVSALRGLLQDGGFLSYTLALSLAQASMFAYITSAPFVFITLHGVSPTDFAWFFGINAAGYIGASQLNARLVRSRPPAQLLVAGLALALTSAASLLAIVLVGIGSIWAIAAGLFGVIASLGLVMPNATALALEEQGERAGVAAAWLGAVQFAMAAAASSAINVLNDGTDLPMAAVIFSLLATSAVILALTRLSHLRRLRERARRRRLARRSQKHVNADP